MSSSRGPHFLWNEKNNNKDWPAAPYSWSYRLQNLYQGVRGRDSWPVKGLGPILETVSHSLLQALWEGTTRAMVGLKGLHTSDAFQHLNISASVGLKPFCPWCFKFGGNTETFTTHLREVHYRLARVCDPSPVCQCRWFRAPIRVQDKVTQEVQGKETGWSPLMPVSMSPAGWQNAWDLPSNPANECGSF